MELWVRTGPHRINISDDNISFSPDVLDTWINQAVRALITIDRAMNCRCQNAGTPDAQP